LQRIRKDLEEPFNGRALAEGLKNLSEPQEFDGNALKAQQRLQQQQKLFGQGPAGRLMNRLLVAANPDNLAAVGPYERGVFRIKPTRMQKSFDQARLNQALQAFKSEQQEWKEAAAIAGVTQPPRSSMVSDPRAQLRLEVTADAIAGLDIGRGDGAALFSVNLIGDGAPFQQVLSQTSLADPSRRFLNSQIAPVPAAKDDPLVKTSAQTDAFQKSMSAAFGGNSIEPLSESTKELVLNPDKVDPLALMTSDLLDAYSQVNDLDIVASLPDSTIGALYFVSRENPLRLAIGMKALQEGGEVSLRTSDGWAVLTPNDRYESRMYFTPRGAVATLMKAVHAKGRLDIRNYAKYAFDSGRIPRMGIGEWYLALYDRANLVTLDGTDWNGLRLYGSFNAQQQEALESGAKFAIGGMTPAQKSIVARMAYIGVIRSEVRSADGSSTSRGRPIEPTSAFQDGLPSSGNVTAKAQRVPVLVAYGKGSDGKTRPLRSLNAATLAAVELEVTGIPSRQQMYGVPGLVGYATGANKLITMRVEFAPGVWREIPMTVADYDPNAKPGAWDKLPEADVKQIRASMDQLKAQKANEPGRVIPPEIED
jgi:hypothetical protein